MKKSFLLQTRNIFALLFFALIAPVFVSSDASAACTYKAPSSGTASKDNPGTCTSTISGNVCAVSADGTTCGAETIMGTVVSGDANNNAFVSTMCRALKIVTGNGGKAFAAFAIISLGIGFFTGKVSWGLMIGVAAGIAAMFGAPTIVAAISGGTAYDCGS